jgi:ADP-ribose pyrophosphatase YjhB (NUDIX family)
MTNYFQGTSTKPYHISIGAILINDEGKIACHHFTDHPRLNGEAFILMRETMEPNETIEETLHRGLREEFGAKGEILTYVGSLVKPYKAGEVTVQKTTLYLLVKLNEINEYDRDTEDPESTSTIEWHKPESLAKLMKSSAKKLNMPDMDESEIIKRLIKLNLV